MWGRRPVRSYREGFAVGENVIAREDERVDGVGFDFAIHRLRAGERIDASLSKESVWILMSGEAKAGFGGAMQRVRRASLFDERPTVLSAGAGSALSIESVSETEWAVARVRNEAPVEPRLFPPEAVGTELRGKGLAGDMSLREVRLVFDGSERPESKLVVGEVVTYPGRWSSYPPHHHPQPELYHYRFTANSGYGHAELGDEVFKIRQYDTITIPGGRTHAQVAAPGYGMYYLWIVRHLDDRPYRGFEYAPEHRWVLDPHNQGWRPPGADD